MEKKYKTLTKYGNTLVPEQINIRHTQRMV